jgi:sulfide:quinone oxidoreductase
VTQATSRIKAGSVAHFEAEILTENILHYIKGEPLREEFDGHANCFVETGNGKAILLDFNYTHEPVEGTFPFPVLVRCVCLRRAG